LRAERSNLVPFCARSVEIASSCKARLGMTEAGEIDELCGALLAKCRYRLSIGQVCQDAARDEGRTGGRHRQAGVSGIILLSALHGKRHAQRPP
jgi:hypothetical protein